MKAIANRLREPSTWAGISGLLLANAMVMGDDHQPVLGGLAIAAGLVAIILKDPGHAS